jgi:hypothetical protein
MPKKSILAFILCCLIHLLLGGNLSCAYQVELDYYAQRTLDTVTPEGIYYQVVIYLNAPQAVMNKISYVTYQLQDSFYRKSIVVRSRVHNFQLVVDALSHFYITAQAHFTDGKNLTLTQYVILETKRPPRDPVHQVSISHDVLQVPFKPKQEEGYTISLFLEGNSTELAQVDKVEYYFPSSTSQAPITVHGPSTDFHLQLELTRQSSIQAYVYFKDGTVRELVRFVYFKYY